MQPSQEQQVIIDYLKNGENVVVDACAGSGKSTTVLSAASQMHDKKFIQLTFNRALSAEISERVVNLRLENIRVFTYHSLLVHYYNNQGYTDQEMRLVLNNDMSPIQELPDMDILVIDEAQDMSMLYFRFIVKFCKDLGNRIQLLILGDEQQALYGFNGSDTRFLTQASSIWKDFPLLIHPTFHACILQTSYRVTLSMARFVNEIMMGKTKMVSTGRFPSPVIYVRKTNIVIADMIVRNICSMLNLVYYPKEKGGSIYNYRRRRPGEGAKYAEQDFFILAQSVKSTNSIVSMIESLLTYNGISCYLPSSDDIDIDERVTAHKVVFSSFCRAKGRQRKIVYVIGFDQTHFRYKSDVCQADWIHCQNDLYVACTRASEHLCVCESIGPSVYHQPLRFLKQTEDEIKAHEMVRYAGETRGGLEAIPEPRPNNLKNTSVTDLIRFISDSILESIEENVKQMFVPLHPIQAESLTRCMNPFDLLTFANAPAKQEEEFEKEDDEKEGQEEEEDGTLGQLDIPCLVQIDPVLHIFEDVSAINGIVLPYMYFDRRNPNYMRTDIRIFSTGLKQKHPYLYERANMLPPILRSTTDYLLAGAVLHSMSEKMTFRLQNLDDTSYNWLDPDMVNQCMKRLDRVFRSESRLPCNADKQGRKASTRYKKIMQEEALADQADDALLHFHSDQDIIEHTFLTNGEQDPRYKRIDEAMERILPGIKVRFSCRLDYISKGHIWELKCCNDLVFSHFLQVVIYAWLWRMTDVEREEYDDVRETDNCMFHLYNVRTNEHYGLRATTEELEHVVGIILRGKYMKPDNQLDSHFIETCHNHILKTADSEELDS